MTRRTFPPEHRFTRRHPWVLALLFSVGLLGSGVQLHAQAKFPWQKNRETAAVELPQIAVTAQWLAERLARSDLAIVDARDPETFRQGHLPLAISLPPDSVSDESQIGPLLGRRGLWPDCRIVCYGDRSTLLAVARLFWWLEVAGCRRVHVLQGGLEAWQTAGGELTTDVSDRAAKPWPAALDSSRLATADLTARRFGRKGCEIIDARAAGLGGTAEAMSTPGSQWREGHIPNALPVDFLAWLEEDGNLPPAQHARDLASVVGPRPYTYVDLGAEFIVYDDGASGAGLRGYLLLRMAGIQPLRYYRPGWAEWSARTDLPKIILIGAEQLQERLRERRANYEHDVPSPDRVLLDVRHEIDYRAGHLPGAVHIATDQLADSLETVLQRYWPDIDRAVTPATAYCYGPECIRSRIAGTALARHGFLRIEWLRDGMRAWRALDGKLFRVPSGAPTVPGHPPAE